MNNNTTATRIQVYLVDDHAIFRASLRLLLQSRENLIVVGESGDARHALSKMVHLYPNVVILDITMPGLSGIDAITEIRKTLDRVAILMLTQHENDKYISDALRAGANGYLSKNSDPNELFLAIDAVHSGHPFVSPKLTGSLVRGIRGETVTPDIRPLASLTTRERQVFELLALGHTNKRVSLELTVSVATTKKHRQNLQRKLNCHSTAELARIAINEGILGDSV